MTVTYDSAADAAYIELNSTATSGVVDNVFSLREFVATAPDIHLNFVSGRLVGIEILDASRVLPLDVFPASSGA
jgi:uncharacterized protein YuzE